MNIFACDGAIIFTSFFIVNKRKIEPYSNCAQLLIELHLLKNHLKREKTAYLMF